MLTEIRDIAQKLLEQLALLHTARVEERQYLREYLINMAGEDQHYHELLERPQMAMVSDDVWDDVELSRERKAVISASYVVDHPQANSAFEMR